MLGRPERVKEGTSSIHEDRDLEELIYSLALRDYEPPGELQFEGEEKFSWLRDAGSRLWLDTGDIEAAEAEWSGEFEALTTNNTLVNQMVQGGSLDGFIAYAGREVRQAFPRITLEELVLEIGFLVNARLALSLVQKFGAHVSVELHPDLGFDAHRSLVFARRYYSIDPDFFYVKLPMTPVGFVAVRKLCGEGIPVNFTLGFSARQNYLAARFSNPKFVNVFLGRLNSLVEKNDLGAAKNVGERAALSSDAEIKGLREKKLSWTCQIGASIRSGEQVATLAGMDVLTIPPKFAAEYRGLDIPRDQVRRRNWREMEVDLRSRGGVKPSDFDVLWNVDNVFKTFVDAAVQQGDALDGPALAQLAEDYGVHLFHGWKPEDRALLRQHGKIPQTDVWPGVPLDDLMSISALESFAKDQVELDQRIRDLIQESVLAP